MAEHCIPDSVMDPLLTISGSSSMEEALQILVQTSRTDDGRFNLTLKSVLPVVLHLVRSLSCSSTRSRLLLPLRLLRNLCAGEVRNQDMFIDHDGVEIVSSAINLFGYDLDDDSNCAIVRTGLQLLANASLAGIRHQQVIWKHLFPAEFVKIARIRKMETCDPLTMIIYVCCDGSPRLFTELCKEQGLIIMAELISTATTVGFGEDWLKLLLSRICIEESHLLDLYNSTRHVGSYKNSMEFECKDACFTSEQAFLLQITSEILNDRIEEIQVGDSLAIYVLNIFKKAMGTVDFSSRCRSSLPTGSATIDVLGYSLAILRDTCAQDGIVSHKNAEESSEDVVLLLLSEGLVDLLLNVLQELEPPSQIRKMIKKDDNSDATTSENLKKVCPYKGFRRDIVSVIGNCAHKRKIVQDEVRDKNGVLLLLQQCIHDDDNPYLREWGLWTAWNLLGTNEENSKLVADLEYQESVDVPELLKAGLRVELDPQTRKPKLVNISE
ncbi:hypothetical protein V2J09_017694 [Rumex salicifolius]